MLDLEDLQAYLSRRQLSLPATKRTKGHAGLELERAIRNQLTRAFDTGRLRTSPQDTVRYIRCFRDRAMNPALVRELAARKLLAEAFVVTGGQKNQSRSKELAHFERDDGAWFDFSITGRESSGSVELLAYDFEIRLPPGHGAPFLRFDLNLPGHDNEDRSLRCHVHCGSDEFLVPAPLMTPLELLALFIDGLRMQDSRKKARAPTQCELNWLAQTLRNAVG
jgi:hypothetical protein